MEELSVALPKGRLLKPTTELLKSLRLEGYTPLSRNYRPISKKFPQARFKVFQERDIPIQVSVGNYDLGICGQHWLEELMIKYPQSSLLLILQFNYGCGFLYLACHKSFPVYSLEQLRGKYLCLASECPNLLESQALKLRLRLFRLLPLYGSAYVYSPEDADLVLLPASSESDLERAGLRILGKVVPTNACLIANRESWQRKDLSSLITDLDLEVEGGFFTPPEEEVIKQAPLRLALPDGHQQPGVMRFLKGRGIKVEEYEGGKKRPDLGIDFLAVKVIRPQDMPLQVASGSFDLAITGKDWLLEHWTCFPASPIEKLVEFEFGLVKIVAVVHETLPVEGLAGLRRYLRGLSRPLKVASEYINLADKYSRENHLSPYRLIPTWGASEAFLPEDADLLIENTQTGYTLAEHKLKIIDTLFESTACLIANRSSLQSKREYMERLLNLLGIAF